MFKKISLVPYTGREYSSRHHRRRDLVRCSPNEGNYALVRIQRICGQAAALERVLEEGAECTAVLRRLVAVRMEVNGFMSVVMENYLFEEFADSEMTKESQKRSIDEIISIVRSYLG
ncbi:metal-sensing transcriptional repressor [Burkholderia cepacia]|uniref:metal-sensing transcriptional repressor n=1 Tax=Burkholderia cepacia TaxID=292 RepID=UPI001CF2D5E7|nr:metal-sensing transcriptional repressor [Burkholderia cepacia]MCA8348427.1 metal-sensing transcriptional repressor [Burkholderia cepacia]